MKNQKSALMLKMRCEPREGAEGFYPFTKDVYGRDITELGRNEARFNSAWAKANGCRIDEAYKVETEVCLWKGK